MFGWLRTRTRQRALAAPSKLLNLGCGRQVHPAWVNVDLAAHDPLILPHDLRQPLPFADASFTVVYHSHVLEHLPRRSAPPFLAECFRVLEPGGIIRVVVPDLEGIVRLYLSALDGAVRGDADAAVRHEWLLLELLDQMVRDRPGGEMLRYWQQNPMPAEAFVYERMGEEVRRAVSALRSKPAAARAGESAPSLWEAARFRASGEVHQWMYDRHSLARLLAAVGFIEAHPCAAAESAIPNFSDYHFDIEAGGNVRKPDSLFMEARKPAAPAA